MSFGAEGFLPGPPVTLTPTGSGTLDGLTFAAKDLLDVAGYATGAGNPDWLADQQVAKQTAPAIDLLLDNGARLVGKTVTDELAFSLEGENAHYGTPCNPRAPDRLPGGSSSGSAVAVSGGTVDLALGTDTGGSVRIPASFCGVFGFRPSHGRVPLEGCVPLAPSYDTIGWFARDARVLRAVGEVLLTGWAAKPGPARIVLGRDAFALADEAVRVALRPALTRFDAHDEIDIMPGGAARLVEVYRLVQGGEIAATYREWITERRPHLGPSIAPRFADALDISDAQFAAGVAERSRIVEEIDALLPPGTVALLPTSPTLPLAISTSGDERADFYRRALAMTSVAGHCGRPVLSLPLGQHGRLPVGLSLVGWRGGDEALLALATELLATGMG